MAAFRAANRAVDDIARTKAEQAAEAGAGRLLGAAMRAESADQPLRNDGAQGRREQELLDLHVSQTGDSTEGVIRMDSGQHEMSGKRCLDGDLGRLPIADFTYHHHVRILAQDSAQAVGEGHADLGIHLRLANAVDCKFDWVLDHKDVAAAVVQPLQAGI